MTLTSSHFDKHQSENLMVTCSPREETEAERGEMWEKSDGFVNSQKQSYLVI